MNFLTMFSSPAVQLAFLAGFIAICIIVLNIFKERFGADSQIYHIACISIVSTCIIVSCIIAIPLVISWLSATWFQIIVAGALYLFLTIYACKKHLTLVLFLSYFFLLGATYAITLSIAEDNGAIVCTLVTGICGLGVTMMLHDTIDEHEKERKSQS